MSRATEFIRDELDAYGASCARAATSPTDRGELADWVRLGLTHLQMIRGQELRWAADMPDENADRDTERRREIAALYERWTRSCEPLLQQIRLLQQAGERIEGGPELSEAYQEIKGVLSIPPDRVIDALKHLDQGRFRTTAEIRNELRVNGFTVVPAPKNAQLRRLLMEPDITTSGGNHTIHRRADRG